MRKLVFVLVLLWCSTAHAELFNCFDNARALGSQYYSRMIDPSKNTDANCVLVAGATKAQRVTNTNQQIPLIQSTVNRPLLTPPTQPATKYLKVVSALAVLMTASEMDAVDASIAAAQVPINEAKNEVATNDICVNNTLAEVSEYWQVDRKAELQVTITALDNAIAALSAGAPKTAMVAARDAIVTMDTMFITHMEKAWRYICSKSTLGR